MKRIVITISVCLSLSVLISKAQQSADIRLLESKADIGHLLIPLQTTELQIIPAPKLPLSALIMVLHPPQDKDMVQLTQAQQAQVELAKEKQDEQKQNEIVENTLSVTGNYDLTNLSLDDLQKTENKTASYESSSLAVRVVPVNDQSNIPETEIQKPDNSKTSEEVQPATVSQKHLPELNVAITEIPVKLTFEIHNRQNAKSAAEPIPTTQNTSLADKLQNASYVDVNERIPVSIRRESGSVIGKYRSIASN